MNELIRESTNLYYEIDDCITNLLKSRLDKDENKENEAIFKMESLLVNTMQHISWLVGTMKERGLNGYILNTFTKYKHCVIY